jgi:hypothetical protein
MNVNGIITYGGPIGRESPAPPAVGPRAWDGDGFGFSDLLDVVNPLQHLPVVSAVYRVGTDDDIGTIPRLLGGLLFGGPIGLIAAAVNVAIHAISGRDLAGHVTAAFQGEPSPLLGAEERKDERAARPTAMWRAWFAIRRDARCTRSTPDGRPAASAAGFTAA